jgi:urea transporter
MDTCSTSCMRLFSVKAAPSSPSSSSSPSPSDDEKTKEEESKPPPVAVVVPYNFVDATARGIGQVVFLGSPVSGGVILGGLAIGDPYLASMAALGTATATGTAHMAGITTSSTSDGLLGYNGCLVGCAAAVFGPSAILACTTSTVLGAAVSPFVAVSLKQALGSTVPQWTFAFNFVALTSLLRTRPLLPVEEPAGTVTTTVTTTPTYSTMDVLLSPLTGISQIFVVESALTGGIIVGGIAMYSPGLAVHAVVGSTIGAAAAVATMPVVGDVGLLDTSELAMGLWGFNSALTSMAVGVFFVHSTPTMVLSAGGAAATAAVFGAMKTVFGAYGAPCLTLPFCVTMSACYLLRDCVPGLTLASSPHSPEKNTI